MVEVAGVEPASLKASSVASTCVVVYLTSGGMRETARLSVPRKQYKYGNIPAYAYISMPPVVAFIP